LRSNNKITREEKKRKKKEEKKGGGLFDREIRNKVTGVLLIGLLIGQFCDFSFFC
jgi:hypothetical protein